MKKTQNNTQLGIPKDFLELKNYQIFCKNINKASEDPPVFSIKIDSDILENIICIDLEDFVRMNKFFQKAMDNTINMTEYILDLKDCVIKLKKTYKNFSPVFSITIDGVLMKNSACFALEDFVRIIRFFQQIEDKIKQ